ncbi:MAG TPA: pilin [Candidatus Saccharimonadales bacterium]|nr:pilin [Candidatus Saccharimonadales bacterium]
MPLLSLNRVKLFTFLTLFSLIAIFPPPIRAADSCTASVDKAVTRRTTYELTIRFNQDHPRFIVAYEGTNYNVDIHFTDEDTYKVTLVAPDLDFTGITIRKSKGSPVLCSVTLPSGSIGDNPGGNNPNTGKPTQTTNNCPSNTVCTGIGNISTDPEKLVTTLLTIALGIAGGVAFLLIVYGGFRLVFSQGDPKAVQEARDIITSAVVGLLIIIFSVFILNLIGVDILGLPIGQ